MKRSTQKGFTLVELAIVLTIIGLLIGGILKGQQLIANARVTAQSAQVQAIEAATTTFTDTFSGLPGDITTAPTRLPATGCGGVACVAGNGDGAIGTATNTPAQSAAYGAAPGGENIGFWLNLDAANLISGVSSSTSLIAGGAFPPAKVNNGLLVVNALLTNGNYTGGLYVTVGQSNVTASLSGTGPGLGLNVLTPNQAAQIDRKMDDGVNTTGSVIAYGIAADCTTAPTVANPGGYVESSSSRDCGLSWRVQQ